MHSRGNISRAIELKKRKEKEVADSVWIDFNAGFQESVQFTCNAPLQKEDVWEFIIL
jgi:hypothetical protein